MEDRTPRGDARARQRFALMLLAYLQIRLRHRRLLVRRAVPGALVFLAVVLVWTVGGTYGAKYEVRGTLLPARISETELKKVMKQKADAYHLRISRPDGTHQDFSLQDMGMRIDANTTTLIAHQERQIFKNRLQWWRPIPVEIIVAADAGELDAFIARHAMLVVEPARDASIALVDGTVQITDGVNGKQYGLSDPMHTILETASRLQTEPLRMKSIALEPNITAEGLTATKAKLEATLEQSIVLMVDGQQVQPARSQIAEWITLTPDPPRKTVNIGVNAGAIQEYVNLVASDHSRAPRTRVLLTGGGVVAGSPGVTVTDTRTAATTLTQNLLENKGLQVDLPVRRTAFSTISAPTAGKWIDVDITYKRLYAYDQGGLVRTFLISAGAPATPTVTGTFAIYTKYSRQTMSGPNADGSSYVQPDVPWVNYFYSDFAIHGNYWRPTGYFGNVNSSHGCVGLLPGDAAWLFGWAPIGTPVVVHR